MQSRKLFWKFTLIQSEVIVTILSTVILSLSHIDVSSDVFLKSFGESTGTCIIIFFINRFNARSKKLDPIEYEKSITAGFKVSIFVIFILLLMKVLTNLNNYFEQKNHLNDIEALKLSYHTTIEGEKLTPGQILLLNSKPKSSSSKEKETLKIKDLRDYLVMVTNSKIDNYKKFERGILKNQFDITLPENLINIDWLENTKIKIKDRSKIYLNFIEEEEKILNGLQSKLYWLAKDSSSALKNHIHNQYLIGKKKNAELRFIFNEQIKYLTLITDFMSDQIIKKGFTFENDKILFHNLNDLKIFNQIASKIDDISKKLEVY